MKTLLILSTGTYITKQWTRLPFIPRIAEWFNIQDILNKYEIESIKASSNYWSGSRGIVKSVEYRHDDNDFYVEIHVLCED